jgi:hypothetical protein
MPGDFHLLNYHRRNSFRAPAVTSKTKIRNLTTMKKHPSCLGIAATLVVVLSPLTVRAIPFNLYVSVGQLGGGVGGILEYTPSGAQTTFVSGLQSPRGLAFDDTGNLFVATTNNAGNPSQEGKVLKFAPSGTQSIFGGTGPRFLEALVTDSAKQRVRHGHQ